MTDLCHLDQDSVRGLTQVALSWTAPPGGDPGVRAAARCLEAAELDPVAGALKWSSRETVCRSAPALSGLAVYVANVTVEEDARLARAVSVALPVTAPLTTGPGTVTTMASSAFSRDRPCCMKSHSR